MDFASIPFLLVFLPVFAVAYRLIKPSLRPGWVLLASVAFLAAGQWIALPWLSGLALATYAVGRRIAARLGAGRKASAWAGLGIGLNLGLLLAAKWLVTYGTGGLAWNGFPIRMIVLPLGLSYFTFQMIAYLVDVAQGVLPPEKNVFRFATYVLFFPKLAAGPITKYQAFAGQIGALNPPEKDAVSGLGRIAVGVLKRLFLADPLGLFAASVLNRAHADMPTSLAWLALFACVFQIYFEFSGYMDIALGLGRWIGIKLPENFNYPFLSQSLSEFWRRWHITLASWFREYVFFPLERRRLKFAGQPINLLIVFTLTGLWHGPTWNYIVWGAFHGLVIAWESGPAGRWLRAVWRPFRHLYFLGVVLISWVIFRSPSLGFAFEWLGRLAGFGTSRPQAAGASWPRHFPVLMLAAVVFSLPVKDAFLARLRKSGRIDRAVRMARRSSVGRALNQAAALLWERKRWWLVPMSLVIAAFGVMFLLSQSSPSARFTYAIF